MDVAVDLVVFAWTHDKWHVLLIERKHPPFQGSWAFPGGFVDEDEDLSVAALRELMEETNVQLERLEQIGAFGKPDRDPRKRVISVTYSAMLHEEVLATAGDDAAKAKWFDVNDLPALAFDHQEILKATLERLQNLSKHGEELPTSGQISDEAMDSFLELRLV